MYKIEDKKWPGVAKVLEEMNELGVELGKLMGSNGKTKHWTGDLKPRIMDEAADVLAAVTFMIDFNFKDEDHDYILERFEKKYKTFTGWRSDLNSTKEKKLLEKK